MFSDVTQSALRAAGWLPGRRVDISKFARCIRRREGVATFDAVTQFLSEFGGLRLELPSLDSLGQPEFYTINPCFLHGGFDADDYVRRLGNQAVCPIGVVPRDFNVLMAEDGSVYLSAEADLTYLGWCGADALEGLCTNRPRPLPVPR